MCHRVPLACIVPPHLLQKLITSPDLHLREAALRTLLASTDIRAQRAILAALPTGTGTGGKRRSIYDSRNTEPQPARGTLVRSEDQPPVRDVSVNEAFDGLGQTYD